MLGEVHFGESNHVYLQLRINSLVQVERELCGGKWGVSALLGDTDSKGQSQ